MTFLEILQSQTMAYNKLIFGMFLVAFFIIYFLMLNNQMKKIWILAGSIVFYIWSGLHALIIVLGTAIVVYFTTLRMEKIYAEFEEKKVGLSPKESVALLGTYKKKTFRYMALAFVVIVGLWVGVKVCRLLGISEVFTIGEMIHRKGIIIPLGISYYSLSALGYTLDVFWRKSKPTHNFLDLITAMTYFPHIIQGPISKYDDLLKQLNDLPKFDYDRVCQGLQLMFWGYAKKLILADRIMPYITTIMGDLPSYKGFEVLIAVLLSAVQIYADFSGCMDIVMGISEAIGIKLMPNFNQPFFSQSATEYWTRWHMTLSGWTKAYIFLPIAMNAKWMKMIRKIKKNKSPRLANSINSFVPLICVWLFTGFWHGTGWDYICWGLYWCAIMTFSNETKEIWDKVVEILHIDRNAAYHKIFCAVRTFCIFAVGRCWTLAGGISGFIMVFKQMRKQINPWIFFDGSLFTHGVDFQDASVAIIAMIVVFLVDLAHEKGVKIRQTLALQPLPIRWCAYIGIIMLVMIFGVYGPEFSAADFAYGAF